MDIEQLADACGGLAWISERLFALQGRLAADAPDAPPLDARHNSPRVAPLDARVRVLLARSSRRHGQHAQWWRAALPDSPALKAEDRINPPSSPWADLMDHLEEVAPVEAVNGLHVVAVPELVRVLEHVRRQWSPVSDGNAIRIAGWVLADVAEEQSEAAGAWTLPPLSSLDELAALAEALVHDRREKRWPPLVTLRQ